MGDSIFDTPVLTVDNTNIRMSLQGTSKIPLLIYSPDDGCRLVFRGFTPSPPEHVAPPVEWSALTDMEKFAYMYQSVKAAMERVDDIGILPIGNDEHLYITAALYAVMEHSTTAPYLTELSTYVYRNVYIIGTYPDHISACATCFMVLSRCAFPDMAVSIQNLDLDGVNCEAMERRLTSLALRSPGAPSAPFVHQPSSS